MRPGNLLGIENPEVHLHPKLQVQVTEMLLDHARSGRRLIIETHSDLVLRRTIRAILAEELPQSQIAIYCVNLTESRMGIFNEVESVFVGSTLEAVKVDKQGRVKNWPDGFLDEDARESQRLLDIMYGSNEVNSDED
jgi:predicted ATPase